MGFLSALFGRHKQRPLAKNHMVYITRQAANDALVRYIEKQDKQVMVVYFFGETRRETERMLLELTNVVWVNGISSASIKQDYIQEGNELVMAETYPDARLEDELLLSLKNAGYFANTITCFDAVDDPVFIPFAPEKLRNMMLKMGLKEDEPIAHRVVTASIARAQQKITNSRLIFTHNGSRAGMAQQLTASYGK